MNIKRQPKTNEECHETRCLIDKVRILGNLRPDIEFSNLFKDCNSNFIENNWESNKGKLLKKHIKFFSGAYMEYTQHSLVKPEIQFDFNPQHIEQEDILLFLNQMQDKRLTYLEIAVDYRIDLSEFLWLDVSNRKSSRIFIDKNRRLETIYLGARESLLHYVIYNKNVQKNNNASIPWWRVEARLRIRKDRYPESLEAFLPENIFADLRGVAPTKENIEDYAKATYFSCFQSDIDKLTRHRRDKLLNMTTSRRGFKQPSVTYNENIKFLQETISGWL